MAAPRKKQADVDLQIDTLSGTEAKQFLKETRARGGSGRRSKYSPIMDAVQAAKAGEIVVVKGVPMSGVMSTRAKLKRDYPEGDMVAKSVKDKENEGAFVLMVGRAQDFG
ncbi:MAG TPA: hypothetical protein VGB53_02725 [Rubricoccaceae bacterium]|jgi:hypothetical protein